MLVSVARLIVIIFNFTLRGVGKMLCCTGKRKGKESCMVKAIAEANNEFMADLHHVS